MIVRAASPEDADAVARSESEAFGPDAWSVGLVAEGVDGLLPTSYYLVADEDGLLAGHAVLSVVGGVAELQRLAVTASLRRHGVGTALLVEALELAAREGAERVLLETRDTNAAALAFYEAHGFVELTRRPRYYRDGSSAVVLERQVAT